MELTDEQRAAAFAEGDSVAVVAGAGTGKTRVLIERYLHLVCDRDVPVPRVLAVTFTEKAARGMKERIRDAFVARGRAVLARQVEFAPISTVHAFLARVLRERALDAGLDPRFAVADEMTAEVLLEQALADTVEHLDADTRDALLDVAGGEDTVRSLYLAACATPWAMEDLRPVAPDLEGLRERTAEFLSALPEPADVSRGTATKIEGLRALAPRLRALDPGAGQEFGALVGGNVATAVRDLFKEARETLKEEWLALALLEPARAAGGALVRTLVELDRRYLAAKRAEGLLDFADLEREGLRLLASDAGAAVAREYDHVLVDEYQDTSRIQQAILDRLARSAARFGVGDEKQSIYRFRYADAAVFRELQRDAATHPLRGSFRSRPELVAFVNELFRGLFAGRDVEPQDLRAAADWAERDAPCVEAIVARGERADDARRIEARTLARRLRTLVEEERPLRSRAVDGEPRPLRYRDCAILLRATTHLTGYERALADEGVPYVVVKGRGYYAAREVVDLAHLLVLLDDPLDHWRAVAVMQSPMAGVPEAVLVQAGPPGGEEGPWPLLVRRRTRPASVAPELWQRWETFATRFEAWQELAGRVATGDLVERILDETRYAELLLLEPDGRRRHANLAKALRRARESRDGPASFARALLEFRERERRESEAPIAAETDEAVRLMTVHASKGLEFPLVAVADLGGGTRTGSGPILRPDGTVGFRLRGENGNREPPGFAALKVWEADQEENERLRLLYVALTRAEEHLILSASFGARAGGAGGSLDAWFDSPPPDVRVVDPVVRTGRDRGRAQAARIRAAIRRAQPLPAGLARDPDAAAEVLARVEAAAPPERDDAPYMVAVADLLEFERCPRRYRLARMLGIEVERPAAEGESFSERADADEHPRRRLGTVFHELAAEVGPAAVPDEGTIRRFLPEATAADVERLTGWHAWLAEQEPARRAAADPGHRREMGFCAELEGLPVRGVIDLYAPGPPLLADYKTSREVRADEYGIQVAIYLAALERLGLPAPATAQLLFVDAQQVVDVPPADLAPLVERFRAAHRDGARFEPHPGPPCTWCDFRPACPEAQRS